MTQTEMGCEKFGYSLRQWQRFEAGEAAIPKKLVIALQLAGGPNVA